MNECHMLGKSWDKPCNIVTTKVKAIPPPKPPSKQAMLAFAKAVNKAMRTLADDSRTIFIGQSVCFDGATIYDSLDGVPMERRLEMPVIEDFQLGYCIGLSLTGVVPVCIFPRMDFMLLACNQLVNHLDKLPLFGWKPKVILRTRVGSKWPLDAGPQHTQNYRKEFDLMTCSVQVREVRTPAQVKETYAEALASPNSFLIVEYST